MRIKIPRGQILDYMDIRPASALLVFNDNTVFEITPDMKVTESEDIGQPRLVEEYTMEGTIWQFTMKGDLEDVIKEAIRRRSPLEDTHIRDAANGRRVVTIGGDGTIHRFLGEIK